MKKIILALFLLGFIGFVGAETSKAQVVPAVKKAAGVTKRTTVRAGRKTASVSKMAARKTVRGTKYVGRKSWHGAKWVGSKTKTVFVGKKKTKVVVKKHRKHRRHH